MNGWTVAGFLVGWILGVWMSHRKIRRSRLETARALAELVKDVQELRITIDENEVVDLATEEGRRRILDTIARGTKH